MGRNGMIVFVGLMNEFLRSLFVIMNIFCIFKFEKIKSLYFYDCALFFVFLLEGDQRLYIKEFSFFLEQMHWLSFMLFGRTSETCFPRSSVPPDRHFHGHSGFVNVRSKCVLSSFARYVRPEM